MYIYIYIYIYIYTFTNVVDALEVQVEPKLYVDWLKSEWSCGGFTAVPRCKRTSDQA